MSSPCPGCGTRSKRIHSRYQLHLVDLSVAGKSVRLVVSARRFHCDAVLCGRRIFTERFEADVLAPWPRRTAGLDHLVHHLRLALGGMPGASFAHRLMVPVSNDPLLRVVRRRGTPRFVPHVRQSPTTPSGWIQRFMRAALPQAASALYRKPLSVFEGQSID